MKIKIKIISSLLALAICLLFFQNCSLSNTGAPIILENTINQNASIKPTYPDINQYVFIPKCLSCHSTGSPNFSSYESLIAGSAVVPSDPEGSTLYQQVGRSPVDR